MLPKTEVEWPRTEVDGLRTDVVGLLTDVVGLRTDVAGAVDKIFRFSVAVIVGSPEVDEPVTEVGGGHTSLSGVI